MKLNRSGYVASPDLLTPRSIGMQYHYALNASFFDLETLATDNVATVKLVCAP